ncbi:MULTISPECIES: EVE domain-containing protein [unclassified Kribbella]|uniref:EVE domain-containing protein n=1 Tax=unclassified Kribbella TaxID=2644121 RepID=UPI00301B53D2
MKPERAWLGVVSAEHARIAVQQNFIQLNHGKRQGVARLRQGDGFVIYSPTDRLGDKSPLRAFTALGVVADAEPYLAEPMAMGARGTIRPWRRRVDFLPVEPVPLRVLDLELTRQPNWGYQLRRGLVSLAPEDFETLRAVMTVGDTSRGMSRSG